MLQTKRSDKEGECYMMISKWKSFAPHSKKILVLNVSAKKRVNSHDKAAGMGSMHKAY